MTSTDTGATPRGRTTITDVARAAGVSVATVSKVINARDGVAASTSAHVLEVVADLGYASSLVATSMRRSRTHVVGVLVAEFEPFALRLLHGVSSALSDTDYDVLAYAGAVSSGSHLGWEARSLSRLGGTLIDGAVVVTPTVRPPETNVPVVSIDPHTGPAGSATVDTDNLRGARVATEHLISLGHTRIGHLRGRRDLESARLRERGFTEALTAAGLDVDAELIAGDGFRAPEAAVGAAHLLDVANPPTAVFAANDVAAIELIRAANTRGIRVPEDLSVIGFDDIPAAIAMTPPLTTVRQPLEQMGRAAVDLLVHMMEDAADPRHIRLDSDLVVRESTAALENQAR